MGGKLPGDPAAEERARAIVNKDELVISEDVPSGKISVMNPIIGGGDVMGAVALISDKQGTAPSQTDIKLTQVAAGFLSKQMEE